MASKWADRLYDKLIARKTHGERKEALDAVAKEEWKRTARFAYRLIITCTDNEGCPDVSEDEFVQRVLDKLGRQA